MSKPTSKRKHLIGGVDPGLASGGLVIIDRFQDNRVLASYSMVEIKGTPQKAKKEAQELADSFGDWSDKEFLAAVLRAEAWTDTFISNLLEFEDEHGQVDVLAIESFVDQRSRAREEKQQLLRFRWHTPLAMGYLAQKLAVIDRTVRNRRIVYQNAGIVIRQWNSEIARLKARGRSKKDLIVPGDGQIGNDHERKAFAHALALELRLTEQSRNQRERENQLNANY